MAMADTAAQGKEPFAVSLVRGLRIRVKDLISTAVSEKGKNVGLLSSIKGVIF